jgi:ABC-2 type transport system ATP-binding protein
MISQNLIGILGMTEIAIRMENITRDFGTVRAVDGISLDVPSGNIFGLLGSNGAGKTTIIHLLLGLLEPTDGRIEVLGFDTHTQAGEVRTRTGALLEHPGLYEQLSAEDNLEFYGRVWRLPSSVRQARIKDLLVHMGMWERRKEQIGTWSRGMKQKLALARALLHRPSLVLLDEPTAGLDVVAAAEVRDDLATLVAREGVTILLTTHNMIEAEILCCQVAVIRDGRLVAVGHPDKLRARSGGHRVEVYGHGFNDKVIRLVRVHPDVDKAGLQNEHLCIDLNEGANVAPLVSLIVSEGVQVEGIHRGQASLEEVFLTLMEEE